MKTPLKAFQFTVTCMYMCLHTYTDTHEAVGKACCEYQAKCGRQTTQVTCGNPLYYDCGIHN